VNVDPTFAEEDKLTDEPNMKSAMHVVAGQEIPPGVDVTLPDPVPARTTRSDAFEARGKVRPKLALALAISAALI
jgi:hypothetical protein